MQFRPLHDRVVVRRIDAEEKTKGGIILVTDTKDRDRLKAEEGTLVAISPLAFTYDDWPEGSRRPEVGERVIFKQYDGLLRERNGRNFRVMNDKSIIGIVDTGETIQDAVRANPDNIAARVPVPHAMAGEC